MTSGTAVAVVERTRHPRLRRVAGVFVALLLLAIARTAPTVVLGRDGHGWVEELFWFGVAGVRLVWLDYVVIVGGALVGLVAVVVGALRGDRVAWALGAAGFVLAAVAGTLFVRALGQYG